MAHRILIVDDDRKHLELMTEHVELMSKEFEIIGAEDGLDGIEKARTQKPDLILMDLRMPRMGGLEATKELKSDPETQGIPIVVFSASVIDDEEDQAYEAGCDDFIEKPIN